MGQAIALSKDSQELLDCVSISTMNGDFAAPSNLTSLDGGTAMVDALDVTGFDFACLGNHETDLGFEGLKNKLDRLKRCKVINSNAFNPELTHLPT